VQYSKECNGGRLSWSGWSNRSERVAFWCVWSFLRCGSYMSISVCSIVRSVMVAG